MHESTIESSSESSNDLAINEMDANGETPLTKACREGDIAAARQLIQNGADVNLTGGQDFTPLIRACESNNLELVKLLLEKKADPNKAGDNDILPPLFTACAQGNIEIIELLINNGAVVNINKSPYIETPLSWACLFGQTESIRVLLKNKADINTYISIGGKDNFQISVLFEDSSTSYRPSDTEIIKLLLENGWNVKDGEACVSSLLLPCARGYTEIVKLFIENGMDVNGKACVSGFSLACLGGHTEIVKLFIKKGLDINQKACISNFSLACERGYIEIFKLFIMNGASIDYLIDCMKSQGLIYPREMLILIAEYARSSLCPATIALFSTESIALAKTLMKKYFGSFGDEDKKEALLSFIRFADKNYEDFRNVLVNFFYKQYPENESDLEAILPLIVQHKRAEKQRETESFSKEIYGAIKINISKSNFFVNSTIVSAREDDLKGFSKFLEYSKL